MKKVIIISIVSLVIIFCAVRTVTLLPNEDGRVSISNGKMQAVSSIGYVFSHWSNGEKSDTLPLIQILNPFVTPVFAIESSAFPVIHVNTEGGAEINSREKYVNCSVSVTSTDENHTFSEAGARIRLRGNSTAVLEKHPYKLKFDSKTSLLGEEAAKEWTLIANHMDYSLLRNYLVYSVAEELDNLHYTTSIHFAEVFVNGSYEGLYVVCEQVQVNKARVDIDESYDTVNTGYLIEMDARATTEGVLGRDYFTASAGHPYAIKSPDTEDAAFTEEHVLYIQNYVNSALAALDSGDWESVTELIDTPSFVDGYILDELFCPVDIGFSSFYMYKDKDGKLCRGPVWDYDLSAGNTVLDTANSTSTLYTANANPWYNKLLTYGEFRLAVAERLTRQREAIENRVDLCFTFTDEQMESFDRNFTRWEVLGTQVSEWQSKELSEIKTYSGQIDYLKSWIEDNLEFLMQYYAPKD